MQRGFWQDNQYKQELIQVSGGEARSKGLGKAFSNRTPRIFLSQEFADLFISLASF